MSKALHTIHTLLKIVGGNIGQRERVLYTTWALTFLWGVLRHYDFAAGDSPLTLLLGASGGVIASYTYRVSGAPPVTPAANPTVVVGGVDAEAPTNPGVAG